jgi:single-strand DNA-binding protein
MASFNKVILMGNLTRDPELRYTPKGTAVARIGLAVNRVWRTETGESREETTFVDCDAFARSAETLCQYLKKGNPVLIEGRLRLHSWEDKQTGQKQNRLRVDIENFRFVGGNAGGGGGAGGGGAAGGAAGGGGRESSPAEGYRARPSQPSAPSSAPEPDPLPSDDDVPF